MRHLTFKIKCCRVEGTNKEEDKTYTTYEGEYEKCHGILRKQTYFTGSHENYFYFIVDF